MGEMGQEADGRLGLMGKGGGPDGQEEFAFFFYFLAETKEKNEKKEGVREKIAHGAFFSGIIK